MASTGSPQQEVSGEADDGVIEREGLSLFKVRNSVLLHLPVLMPDLQIAYELQIMIVQNLYRARPYLGLPGIDDNAVDTLKLPRGCKHRLEVQDYLSTLHSSQKDVIQFRQVCKAARQLADDITNNDHNLCAMSYFLPPNGKHGLHSVLDPSLPDFQNCPNVILRFQSNRQMSAFSLCNAFMEKVHQSPDAPWLASTLNLSIKPTLHSLSALFEMGAGAQYPFPLRLMGGGLYLPGLTTLRLMFSVTLVQRLFQNLPALRFLECISAPLYVRPHLHYPNFYPPMDLPALVVLRLHLSHERQRQTDVLFTFLSCSNLPKLEVFSLKHRVHPGKCILVNVSTIGTFFSKIQTLKSLSLDLNLHIEDGEDTLAAEIAPFVNSAIHTLDALPTLPKLQVIYASPVSFRSLPTFPNIQVIDLIPRFHIQDASYILWEFQDIVSLLQRYAGQCQRRNSKIVVNIVKIANNVLDPLGICAVFALVDAWDHPAHLQLAEGICQDLETIARNVPLLRVTYNVQEQLFIGKYHVRHHMQLQDICSCLRARTSIWKCQRSVHGNNPDMTDFSLDYVKAPTIKDDHPLHFHFAGEVPLDIPRPYLFPAIPWLALEPFVCITVPIQEDFPGRVDRLHSTALRIEVDNNGVYRLVRAHIFKDKTVCQGEDVDQW